MRLEKYSRRNLSYIENFLIENNELEEANKIKSYMGKILKFNSIPQLIPTGNYAVDTSVNRL